VDEEPPYRVACWAAASQRLPPGRHAAPRYSPGRGGERKWRGRRERTAASTSSLGSRAEAPASLSGANRRRAYACRGLGGSLVLRCPRLPRLGRTSCSTWLSAAPSPGSGAAIRAACRLPVQPGLSATGRAGGGEGQREAACLHASSSQASRLQPTILLPAGLLAIGAGAMPWMCIMDG